ncbi:MAG: helix-turn-helix domain-containing protein [Acidobacteriota bacterium]|nr:helix-turn-helix domain-containing protein [Acidobacteriota bacterium]
MTDDADSPYYSVILIQESTEGEIVITTNRGVIRIGAETRRELSNKEIVQPVIFHGKSGAVWAFDADGQLHEARGGQKISYPIYNFSSKRSRVCEDVDGALLLAAGATFYQFKNGTTIEYSEADFGKPVTRAIRFEKFNQAIYQNPDGNFWTSEEDGLLIFNPLTGKRTWLNARNGLPARGKKGGRPIKLTPKRIEMAKTLMNDPNITIDSICQTLNISKPTLYRYCSSPFKNGKAA